MRKFEKTKSALLLLALGLIVPLSLYSGDQKYSPTAPQRHRQMAQDLIEKPLKEKRQFLTGDWNTARTYLAEKGITFTGVYVTDTVGNPVGGKARGFAYAGSFGLDVLVDLDKTTPLKGLAFYSSMVWRTGTSLSERKIGNQFPVQQVFGHQTVKLNSVYLQQTFLDRRIMIRLGRLNGGDTFLQSPLFYHYVNNAIDGNPVSPFFSTPFTAYPNAVWGAYFRGMPVKQIMVKFGAYQGNKKINENRFHGINFSFKSPQGVLLASEITYLFSTDEGRYPGNYKVGYFYINRASQEIQNFNTSSNQVLYLQFDQKLYEEELNHTSGLSGFTTFVLMPEDRNEMPFFFVAGLVYRGLFPGRENDFLAAGTAMGRYSKNLRQKQRDEGQEVQYYEVMLELNYNAHITPWFWLQPDIQYIIRPDGLKSRQNALVLGFQAQVNF